MAGEDIASTATIAVRADFQHSGSYSHPGLVDPLASQLDPLNRDTDFNAGHGLALTFQIVLTVLILAYLRKGALQFYSFFLVEKPYRSLKLSPIKMRSNLQSSTFGRRFNLALKGPAPRKSYAVEQLIRLSLLVTVGSCMSLAFQANRCLLRNQAQTSFECLDQGRNTERHPYVAGFLVGLICTLIQLRHEFQSLRAFADYATQFEFDNDHLLSDAADHQNLDLDKLQSGQAFDSQSQTTAGQLISDRGTLISQRSAKEALLVPGYSGLKKPTADELVPIDEDDNDEYCSPLKRRAQCTGEKQKSCSPVKRFNGNDSARSEEHISPSKGAIQMLSKHSIDNESADDGELVIKAMRIETMANLGDEEEPKEGPPTPGDDQLLSSAMLSEADKSKTTKPDQTEQEYKASKRTLVGLLAMVLLCICVTMVTLYYFANLTPQGLSILWKSIAIALCTNLGLQLPVFSLKYVCSGSLRKLTWQTNDQMLVLNEFWHNYQTQSFEIFSSFDLESGKQEELKCILKVENTTIEFTCKYLCKIIEDSVASGLEEQLNGPQRFPTRGSPHEDDSNLQVLRSHMSDSNIMRNNEDSIPHVKPFMIDSPHLEEVDDNSQEKAMTPGNNDCEDPITPFSHNLKSPFSGVIKASASKFSVATPGSFKTKSPYHGCGIIKASESKMSANISDASMEEIELSPPKGTNHNEEPQMVPAVTPRQLTSHKQQLPKSAAKFSSLKKGQQFETPQDFTNSAQKSAAKQEIALSASSPLDIKINGATNTPAVDENTKEDNTMNLTQLVLTPMGLPRKQQLKQQSLTHSQSQSLAGEEEQQDHTDIYLSKQKTEGKARTSKSFIEMMGRLASGGYSKLVKSFTYKKKKSEAQKNDSKVSATFGQPNQGKQEIYNNHGAHEFSPMWSSVKRDSAGKYQTEQSQRPDEEDRPARPTTVTVKASGLMDLHTINQLTIEDSPLTDSNRRHLEPNAEVAKNDYTDISRASAHVQKKYYSPGSLAAKSKAQSEFPKIGSQTALKSKRGSAGFEYGGREHTTARKRRLMLLDDAACSSINFNRNGSAEFGSAARGSGLQHSSGTRRIQYYSLGSVGTPLKHEGSVHKNSILGEKDANFAGLLKNESEVEMGAGDIDADEDVDIQVQQAYTNLPYANLPPSKNKENQEPQQLQTGIPQPYTQQPQQYTQQAAVDCDKSDVSALPPKWDKSRKVLVLHADSEIDSSSVRPSILGYNKSDFSDPQSPKYGAPTTTTAFEKLIQAANKAIDSGRNGKRSHSVNQTVGIGERQQSKGNKDISLFKQPFLKKQGDRRQSEPGQEHVAIKTVSALSQNLHMGTQPQTTIEVSTLSQNMDEDADNEVQLVIQSKLNNKSSAVRLSQQSRYNQQKAAKSQDKENTVPKHYKQGNQRLQSRGEHYRQTFSQQPPSSKSSQRQGSKQQPQGDGETQQHKPITQQSHSALDLNDYDKLSRVEDGLSHLNRVMEKNWQAHKEEQRRRLDHFLSVAKQVRAFKDVLKIKELLKELHDTGKALPHARINELRNLDVMTSPYNQTLLSMLKVENQQLKKLKEQQIRQSNNQSSNLVVETQESSKPTQVSMLGATALNSDVTTPVECSFDANRQLHRVTSDDLHPQQQIKQQPDNSRATSKQSNERQRRLKQAGHQVLGPKTAQFIQRNGVATQSKPSEVYQIQTKYEPLPTELALQQPKSSLSYMKPDLMSQFENLRVENVSSLTQSKESL